MNASDSDLRLEESRAEVLPSISTYWQTLRSNQTNRKQKLEVFEGIPLEFHHFAFVYTGISLLIGIVSSIYYIVRYTPIWRHQRCVTSSALYLIAIGAADLSAISLNLLQWLEKLPHIVPYDDQGLICKVATYLGHIGCALSAWLIAEITLDRFLIFKAESIRGTSLRRTRFSIAATIIVGMIYNLWFLHIADVFDTSIGKTCGIGEEYNASIRSFDICQIIAVFTFPMFVLIGTALATTVTLAQRWHRHVNVARYTTVKRANSCATMKGLVLSNKHRRDNRNMGISIIVTTVLYVSLNGPMYCLRLYFYHPNNGYIHHYIIELIHLLYTSQYCLHCLIYSKLVPKCMVAMSRNGSLQRSTSAHRQKSKRKRKKLEAQTRLRMYAERDMSGKNELVKTIYEREKKNPFVENMGAKSSDYFHAEASRTSSITTEHEPIHRVNSGNTTSDVSSIIVQL